MFSQISAINDYLYLSGVQPIRPDKVRHYNISSIVTATVEEPPVTMPGVESLKVRLEDSPYSHLDAYFDMVADRIKSVKDAGGKVLVHCIAGVSRSASLVLAYLMKYEKLPLREAYWRVKAVRPIIRPNTGFWKQLINYERKLHGRSTVKFVPSKWGDEEVPDVYTDELKGFNLPSLPLAGSTERQSNSRGNSKSGEGDAASALKNSPRERSIPISMEYHPTRPPRRPRSSRFYNSSTLVPSLPAA